MLSRAYGIALFAGRSCRHRRAHHAPVLSRHRKRAHGSPFDASWRDTKRARRLLASAEFIPRALGSGSALRSGGELVAQRYRVLADLGGRSMARVFAVVDTSDGKRVALKRPTLQGSAEQRRRITDLFAREFHCG
jgi:hypothetical protein